MKIKSFLLVLILSLLASIEIMAQNRSIFEETTETTKASVPMSRDNCCLCYVTAVSQDLNVTSLDKINIYDKDGLLIGTGSHVGKYLVPHDGTIKIFWQYAPYGRLKNYDASINVGVAYEIFIQLYKDKAGFVNPENY